MGMIAAYIAAYRAGTRQLRDRRIARDWILLGIPVEQAIEWAGLGYLPAEAAAAGMDLDRARRAAKDEPTYRPPARIHRFNM